MNFIENLSLSSGLQARRPLLSESFFPVVAERYITIHTENHQSKQWDHLQEFIDLIKPILKKENIQIIELGWNKVPLGNIDFSIKQADPKQAAYIISKSLLHLGVENFLTQLASFYDTPCVSLYSNTSPDVFPSLWGENFDYQSSSLVADLKGLKPSYMGEENPKTINKIPPEAALCKVLDILGINHDFDTKEVLFMGPSCHAKCLEVIPNFTPEPSFFPQSVVNVRMDYHFNEGPLQALASNRKISIVTDQPININILRPLSPNIEALFIKINESFDSEYIDSLKSLGKTLAFILDPALEDADIRTKFFDLKIIPEEKKKKKDLDNSEKICDTTRYKSSKMVFSNNKQYSSKAAWEQDIPSHDDQPIIDCDSFWEESDYMKLYNIHDKHNKENNQDK